MSETDDRVDVQIDIPDDVLFQLMLAAHEQDITLNQMVEQILRQELEKEQPREHTD